jgi:predicted amidohydrolase
MNKTLLRSLVFLSFLLLGVGGFRSAGCPPLRASEASTIPPGVSKVRVAAAQPKNRTIDFRMKPADVLAQVEKSLDYLEKIVKTAGASGCDALALPEDTLGLLKWEAANQAALKEVLPQAVKCMLDRLGRAAAAHRMYLVACNDTIEPDGTTHNTAFLLGRDGKEIGRYHKVNLPLGEQSHARGNRFPVFDTPDLGGVGLLICYDMVFPEAPRCLALAGADIIFHPTLGGAAIGDDEMSLAAFRTRAVENFVYLVVAMRGSGSMIISPQGKVIARATGADGIAVADIDPTGGREGGDAFNTQRDMRGRLFRERAPDAYRILTDPNPPVLAKVPSNVTRDDAIRIAATVLTVGEERFREAGALARAGKKTEAVRLYEKLCAECPTSWIERAARERLVALRETQTPPDEVPPAGNGPVHNPATRDGIAAKYPGDRGIEHDPRVVFAENFEEPSLDALKTRWEQMQKAEIMAFSEDVSPASGGKRSLQLTHVGGEGNGGHLYRTFKPGYDKLYARFYVKFDRDCAPIHHFGTNMGGYNPPTPWPQGGAGLRPAGDKTFTIGVEPFGESWVWDYYTYWCDMEGSPPRGQTWGNSFIRDPGLKVERDRWICVELMVKLNDVGDTNGALALWIDGKPVSHLGKGYPKGKWVYDKFSPGEDGEGIRWNPATSGPERFSVPPGGRPFPGFRWRTVPELNLNYLWVYLYITHAPPGHKSRVWYDDIVVATEYIGPVQGNPARARVMP